MTDDEKDQKRRDMFQARRDLLEQSDYVKDMNGNWSWRAGKKHQKTKHVLGADKPKLNEELDSKLNEWKKRKDEREERKRKRGE